MGDQIIDKRELQSLLETEVPRHAQPLGGKRTPVIVNPVLGDVGHGVFIHALFEALCGSGWPTSDGLPRSSTEA